MSVASLSPKQNIKQDISQLLFEDIWNEISPHMTLLMSKIVSCNNAYFNYRKIILLDHSTSQDLPEDHPALLENHDFDQLIKTPNLQSAMTIRPVPLHPKKKEIRMPLMTYECFFKTIITTTSPLELHHTHIDGHELQHMHDFPAKSIIPYTRLVTANRPFSAKNLERLQSATKLKNLTAKR